jgi:hypothetical protein
MLVRQSHRCLQRLPRRPACPDCACKRHLLPWHPPACLLSCSLAPTPQSKPTASMPALTSHLRCTCAALPCSCLQPRSHTIIEAHPDVYKYACSLGWDSKPGVRLVLGRWQDVIDEVGLKGGQGASSCTVVTCAVASHIPSSVRGSL